MNKPLTIFALLMGMLFPARAAYLENVPQTLIQPNGDTLHCLATGDEYYHYLHDAEGYTIMLDVNTGYYVYADKVDGRLIATEYVAGRVNPASVGLVPHINITPEQWLERRRARENATPATRGRIRSDYARLNHGTINNIVVFIRFADELDFTNDFNPVSRMFNDSTGTRQSMLTYFRSATYGQLDIRSYFYPAPDGSTILSYQDVHPRSYYQPYSAVNPEGYREGEQAEREHPLLQRAINYIADMVPEDLDIDHDDDGYVDNVVFVVRGNVGDWNDLLWPHKWSLYTQSAEARIHGKRVMEYNIQLADNSYYFSVSTLCHEMNHTLGAPDLYHYYTNTSSHPVGPWDLMHSNAHPPQHMGAYMKYKYGTWLDSIPEITDCGTYSLHALGTSATNNCYKIAGPNEHEFFVLEYRNNESEYYETSLPSSGLLIYRINDQYNGNGSYNGTDQWDEIYIFRPNGTIVADGNINHATFSAHSGRTAFNSETNPRPFMTDGSFFDDLYIHQITSAGGDSITFTYCAEDYVSVTEELVEIAVDSGATASFKVNSDLTWEITYDCDWLDVTPVSDSGTVIIGLTAIENNQSVDARECLLTVTASNGRTCQVIVRQSGIEPVLEVTLDTNTLENSLADTIVMYIRSNMDWRVSASAGWLEWTGATGRHDEPERYYYDTVYFHANSMNDACSLRLAVVNLIGQDEDSTVTSVILYQNGVVSTLSVSADQVELDNVVNASASIQITANMPWHITGNVSWLTVSPMSGSGDRQVTVTAVTTNSFVNPRTAILQFSNECGDFLNLHVSQAPGSLNVVEDEVFLAAAGGSATVAHINCSGAWRIIAASVPDWLQIAPETDSYDGTITITALSANEESQNRSAALRFLYGTSFHDTLVVHQLFSQSGMEEPERNELDFFPNPTKNMLNVIASESFQYVIINTLGEIVGTGEIVPGKNLIDLSDFSSGVYVFRLTHPADGAVITRKIVKK